MAAVKLYEYYVRPEQSGDINIDTFNEVNTYSLFGIQM